MKRLACALGVLVVLLAAAQPADAHRRGRVHFGAHVIVGGPIWWGPWWPYWYPPYYAAPPVIIREEPQPQVYVQQQTPAPPPAQQYWYYCPDSKVYYPYVQECASDWLKVVPQAPAQASSGQPSPAPTGPPPQ
jgi:hypothetical protein